MAEIEFASTLWDDKSKSDVDAGAAKLHDLARDFDLSWYTWGGMPPAEAVERLQALQRTVGAMLSAAQWASS